jgi:hypothetical protein
MGTTASSETMTVLTGMYAAEAEYLAAGGAGAASLEPLAPFFARTPSRIRARRSRITEIHPFYRDTATIADAVAPDGR